METFATGLKRIKDLCDEAGCKVEFRAEKDDFVEEAKSYLESKGYSIDVIIRDLKERQAVQNSFAYRVGKAIVTPFSWLKKQCNRNS